MIPGHRAVSIPGLVRIAPILIIAGAIVMFKTMEQSGAMDITQSIAQCRDC